MMNTASSPIHWIRIVLAGVLAPILSFILVTLIVTAYATWLAIQARGQPDMTQINQFAAQVAPWTSSVLTVLLTFVGAAWVARAARGRAQLHGLLVGLVAAVLVVVLNLGPGRFQPVILLVVVLTLAAGWLGSLFGARRGGSSSATASSMP